MYNTIGAFMRHGTLACLYVETILCISWKSCTIRNEGEAMYAHNSICIKVPCAKSLDYAITAKQTSKVSYLT